MSISCFGQTNTSAFSKSTLQNPSYKNNIQSSYHLENIFSASAKLNRNHTIRYNKTACSGQSLNRTIDGACNNVNDDFTVFWGSSSIQLKRSIPSAYNENSDVVGSNRSNPRAISNAIFKAESSTPSNYLSSFVFTWGQFIDHDMVLTPVGDEELNITVSPNDIITAPIPFKRSIALAGTGVNGIAREQVNNNTAWIDASQVYGSDMELASQLRAFKNGKLKTALANNGEIILPSIEGQIIAGDERALEQPGLTSLQILFLREHNRICDALVACGETDDETIYQKARKKVGALIQSITYNEFLLALGIQLPEYKAYDNALQPDILNVFATAVFRLGHTMVTDELVLYNNEGQLIERLPLAAAFFNPSITQEKGIETILYGLSQQFQERVDAKVVESLRSFLFGAPPNAGLDLVALNIQRGRDHGLADYNSYRTAFGIESASDFNDITSNTELLNNLKSVYDDVNDIDVWVGLLAEDHLPNAAVGPTLMAILSAQFIALRNGDYYFYKNDPALSEDEKKEIDNTRLSDIIKRNTAIKNIKYNVFYGPCNIDNSNYNCVPDEIVCDCAITEICNQGYCEPIAESKDCTFEFTITNNSDCEIVVYDLKANHKKYVAMVNAQRSFTYSAYNGCILKISQWGNPVNKRYYFVNENNLQSLTINTEICE